LIKDAESSLADATISCDPPTEDEVAKAIRRLKSGKAPGICDIPAVLLKVGNNVVVKWLTAVIRGVWETGRIPSDWRKGIILPQYKGKGSRRECKNYWGITLLSVPGKVFAFTLLSRIKAKLLESRRVEQSGFTPGRSTVDRILTLNTLIQTRREFGQPFWVAYVDLKSAFDSVNRESLWLLLYTWCSGKDSRFGAGIVHGYM